MSDVRVGITSVEEVAREIYGDGAWEITRALRAEIKKAKSWDVAASGAERSGTAASLGEISKDKEERRDRVLNNVAIAGNAASAVAGPAAIYAAVRNRSEGGIPRDIGRPVAAAAMRSKHKTTRKAGVKTARAITRLNKPLNTRQRVAAGIAGGTMVGLQVANMGTDVLSTKLLNDKKKKEGVAKAAPGILKPLKPKIPQPMKPAGAMKPIKPLAPKKPSIGGVQKNFDWVARGEISKSNDKRQVFGWASIVEINGEPVVDLQNDYVTIEEIEKAAYDYVHNSRKGGDMHRRDGAVPVHKSDLVESFVVTPEKKQMLNLPDDTPVGWWVGFQVNDDELWQLVKDGKRPMFSIHGSGQRIETEI